MNADHKKEIISDNRRNNLKLLEGKYTRKGLEEKTGKSYKILTKYINGYQNSIGRNFAIDIETSLDLPEYWMDKEHESLNSEEIKTPQLIPFENTLSIPILNIDSFLPSGKQSMENKTMNISDDQVKSLQKIGTDAYKAMWLEIQDDSMLPYIEKEAWVIVDTDKKEVESGGRYALKIDDQIVARRIYKEGSAYKICCDNANAKVRIPDRTVNDFSEIHLIGKLVWMSGRI